MNLLAITDSDVVFEEYEDEIIFLQLRQGFYYTLDRIAGDVIVALLRAATLDEALNWLHQRYAADKKELLEYCEQVWQRLASEQLFEVRPEESQEAVGLEPYSGNKSGLTPFSIEKFEDIQDILMFDPVHEVNEEGWPSIIDK